MRASKIFWYLVLTGVVIAWAVSALIPFKDTPFEDYIKTRATANEAEFATVLVEAGKRVNRDPAVYKNDKNKSSTLFVALKEYATQNGIDLGKYFPDVNVRDIKILKKKNDVLVTELYRQSKSSLKKGLDLQGGVSFTLEIDKGKLNEEDHARDSEIEDVLRVINNRVNGLGVSEPNIRRVGSNAVEVQMPGVSLKDNPEAVEQLSRPAKLEFKLVDRFAVPSSMNPPINEIPHGYVVMPYEHERGNQVVEDLMYVKYRAECGGDVIEKAGVRLEDMNRYAVDMKFSSSGAKRMEDLTTRIMEEDKKLGKKQPLAIVLDGKLMSAPVIQSVLSTGGQITGNFSRREAIELANALNNPLKVGLKRTSMNEVGPSLAEDASDSAIYAALVGCGLVVLFMVMYYMGLGLIAIISVGVNILIVLGVLASFGATMTLPGIAALVLTVGMAVDANILIYERMREELKVGKGPWVSLQAGYDKAFSTIVDANLTTLLTAVILWQFGTGAVKGFGVTLSVGILATLFCALIFARALTELSIGKGIFTKSFKFQFINETKFDFLKWAKPAFIFSFVIMLIGIIVIVYRGDKSLGIDFTGGEVITLNYKEKVPMSGILDLSKEDGNLGELQASYQTDVASGSNHLSIQVESDKGEAVFEALAKKYPEAGLSLVGKESIGAAVSSEITWNAIIALMLALLVIALYVAFRFEIGYGIGALVSTVHDIFITVGVFVMLGMVGIGSGQFTAPMVAAILMIVGYSINDTIVVFDRIREELDLNPGEKLYSIMVKAMNKTLSRTILTSLTTFLAALALYIFGTGIVKDFSLLFLIGIVTGTFSTLFIASPIFYYWHKGSRERVKHDEEVQHDWEA